MTFHIKLIWMVAKISLFMTYLVLLQTDYPIYFDKNMRLYVDEYDNNSIRSYTISDTLSRSCIIA